MNGAQILGIFLVILVVVVICSSIRVVPQAHAYVIERLGTYNTTWSAGLHLKTPLIDKVAHRISMKEQVVDFAPQPVITKDNVTMRIDTVVFFQITDPKLFAYGVEKPIMAIELSCGLPKSWMLLMLKMQQMPFAVPWWELLTVCRMMSSGALGCMHSCSVLQAVFTVQRLGVNWCSHCRIVLYMIFLCSLP